MARQRARSAGFGEAFGREEAERIRRMKKEVGGLEVRLKDERAVRVTVEQDTEAIVERINEVLDRVMARNREIMTQMIQEHRTEQEENAARNATGRAIQQGGR